MPSAHHQSRITNHGPSAAPPTCRLPPPASAVTCPSFGGLPPPPLPRPRRHLLLPHRPRLLSSPTRLPPAPLMVAAPSPSAAAPFVVSDRVGQSASSSASVDSETPSAAAVALLGPPHSTTASTGLPPPSPWSLHQPQLLTHPRPQPHIILEGRGLPASSSASADSATHLAAVAALSGSPHSTAASMGLPPPVSSTPSPTAAPSSHPAAASHHF